MHQIDLSHIKLLLVEVPEDSSEHFINDLVKDNYLLTYYLKSKNHYDTIRLPAGLWSIIGTTPLTEEQASMVVESWESVWKDGTMIYENYLQEIPKCRTALKSFHSLLKSTGIDTTKRWVVLIKKKHNR